MKFKIFFIAIMISSATMITGFYTKILVTSTSKSCFKRAFFTGTSYVLKDKNDEYSDLESEYFNTKGPLITW